MARTSNPNKKAEGATTQAADADANKETTQPDPAAAAANKPESRIQKLEQDVKDLYNLLHEHGIRHKPATTAKE